MFTLPVAALSIAVTALPLPTHKEMMNKVAAAAAVAAGGSSDSSSSEEMRAFDAFNDARRMATIAAVVSDVPVRCADVTSQRCHIVSLISHQQWLASCSVQLHHMVPAPVSHGWPAQQRSRAMCFRCWFTTRLVPASMYAALLMTSCP
jgi:hypothetical protein